MGRNQHSKDRLFITATEWAVEYGGKKRERHAQKRVLPFDSCALSLQPYASPVCTADGVIFDAENILPFLKEHKCSPITAEPMRFRDLVTLHMAKNADGKWHCPVTFKVFNDNSRICCVRTSGHVYAYEAVAELNIKAKNWKDLMTDEPFKRADIIMLQDPIDEALKSRRDIANFSYLKQLRDDHTASVAATPASAHIRATPGTARLFKEIEAGRETHRRDEAAAKEAAEAAALAAAEKEAPDLAAIRRLRPTVEDLNPGSKQTSGAASWSMTSSSVAVATRTELRPATVDEIREARWRAARKVGKKGYAQLQTR
jgi:peptidyl-prolyl cis-trans isomerase-like protein 2